MPTLAAIATADAADAVGAAASSDHHIGYTRRTTANTTAARYAGLISPSRCSQPTAAAATAAAAAANAANATIARVGCREWSY